MQHSQDIPDPGKPTLGAGSTRPADVTCCDVSPNRECDPQTRLMAAIAVLGAMPLDLSLGEEVVDLQHEVHVHLDRQHPESGR